MPAKPQRAKPHPHLRSRVDQVIESFEAVPPLDGDQLLSVPELAHLLKVSAQWVDAARHYGTGPKFIRIGRRCLYRRDDVREWLQNNIHTHAKRQVHKRRAKASA